MIMASVSVPVPILAAVAAAFVTAVAISVSLFLSVKRELRRMDVRHKRQQILLQEAYDRVEAGLERMRGGIRDLDEKTMTLAAPPLPKSGLNLNKRTQATRMFRRGDRPDQIATALSMPQNEVLLLLKVQEASITQSA
jgi:hypothetical protein